MKHHAGHLRYMEDAIGMSTQKAPHQNTSTEIRQGGTRSAVRQKYLERNRLLFQEFADLKYIRLIPNAFYTKQEVLGLLSPNISDDKWQALIWLYGLEVCTTNEGDEVFGLDVQVAWRRMTSAGLSYEETRALVKEAKRKP
ncbi:MAG: hypothetical protein NXI04_15935 [Planctomycetaceae bacterium]|nr:hypothetical protein [Planctomycetaceae bacterium]